MSTENPAKAASGLGLEYALLVLLSVMWGSSYLFISVALTEIPPISLIAIRVVISAIVLVAVLRLSGEALPRSRTLWGKLLIMAVLNSIGAWTLLAWGQQYVDSSLASILNSSPPIFVVLFMLILKQEFGGLRPFFGVVLGLAGVTLIIGYTALAGLELNALGQAACVLGAACYGAAAIYSHRLSELSALQISACTMIWASVVIGPTAFWLEGSAWAMPSAVPLAAALALALFSTAFALLIYFRLVRTLGPLGAASQSYLRVGVGVLLGILLLGESLNQFGIIGFVLCIAGVLLINWPRRNSSQV